MWYNLFTVFMEEKPRAQFTPEHSPSAPETLEIDVGEKQPISQRALAERVDEPQVPLGSLVQESEVAPLPSSIQGPIDEKVVEAILEEDLEEIYGKLTPAVQQRFRLVGEQTTHQVAQLLAEMKIQIEKIIGLIRKWLALIPGVSKFFLEQATKIKMDKLMRLRQPPK